MFYSLSKYLARDDITGDNIAKNILIHVAVNSEGLQRRYKMEQQGARKLGVHSSWVPGE
jgi:hypothetical protein